MIPPVTAFSLEIWLRIIRYSDLGVITALSGTSFNLRTITSTATRRAIQRDLSAFVQPVENLQTIMSRLDIVLVGSFMLGIILDPFRTWDANNLDFICSSATALEALHNLITVEDDYVFNRLASATQTETLHNHAIHRLCIYRAEKHGRTFHINIMLTKQAYAGVRSIPRTWSSLLCNYMTANDLVCTFPRWTLRNAAILFDKVFTIADTPHAHRRNHAVWHKYLDRSFLFTAPQINQNPHPILDITSDGYRIPQKCQFIDRTCLRKRWNNQHYGDSDYGLDEDFVWLSGDFDTTGIIP